MSTEEGILRDPALVEVRGDHLRRLEALFAGQNPPPGRVFCHAGIAAYTEAPEWESWLPAALELLREQADRALDRRVFRPLLLGFNPHGVHFVDQLFGAEVFWLPDGGWQAHPLAAAPGRLEAPDLDHCEAWRQVRRFARHFLDLDLTGVLLMLPTISSALNVAVNLYGQRLLEAMMLDPEAAHRDLRLINDVLCELHRWFLRTVPPERMQCIAAEGRTQPPGSGQLCGCTSQLLSPELYEEFVAPLDDALLAVYPRGGMIHLCGVHGQHVPVWRSMATLRAVQMNDRASEDLECYYRGLREDQILYVHPCEGMPWQRVLEITQGRRVVLCADIAEVPCLQPS